MPSSSKILPLTQGAPAPLDTRPAFAYDKGSIEHYAFMSSDLALRLFSKQMLPAYVCDLALAHRCSDLHHAAYHGSYSEVDALLRRGFTPSSANHSHGMQPLHLAAMRGHVEIVRRLIAAGARPDARDRWRRRTAARWARSGGHVELARALDKVRPGQPLCEVAVTSPSSQRARQAMPKPKEPKTFSSW